MKPPPTLSKLRVSGSESRTYLKDVLLAATLSALFTFAAYHLSGLRREPHKEIYSDGYSENNAFTLIELSIVLVIIGLIVGGVLVGQNLIAAAAVRAQITQIEKFNTAANTFYGKYGYLPGDIPAGPAAQFGFASRGQYAGQGDGNRLLETGGINSIPFGGFPILGEEAMFWVDLSVAHLIDGTFSTATPTTTVLGLLSSNTTVGQYLPQSKISASGYVYVWSGGWQEACAGTGKDDNNYFAVSGVTNLVDWEVPLMTPVQAYAIDKKVDDGFPQSGNVMAVDAEGWASGGPVADSSESYYGDSDPNSFGPVIAGDGEQTPLSQGYPANTTCYDNNNVAGATETYSLKNATMINCWLSFRFQ